MLYMKLEQKLHGKVERLEHRHMDEMMGMQRNAMSCHDYNVLDIF